VVDQNKNLGLYYTYIKVLKNIFYLYMYNKMASWQYKKRVFLETIGVHRISLNFCPIDLKF
jgi:hypothetical protein